MKTEETKIIYGRPKMTIDEYLHFENSTIEKNEYYLGDVYARGLCNLTHNTITRNTIGKITRFLKLHLTVYMEATFASMLKTIVSLPILIFLFFPTKLLRETMIK